MLRRFRTLPRLAAPFLAVLLFQATNRSQAAPAPDTDDLEVVKQILKEIEIPPPMVNSSVPTALKVDDLPRFTAKTMEPYREDRGQTPLRQAVVKARDELRAVIKAVPLKDQFLNPTDPNIFRRDLLDHQKEVARSLLRVTNALEELQKAGEQRAKEPSKRWQANYDYLAARLQIQVAFLYEYQSALGALRRGIVELTDPEHTGWRLVPQEKAQGDQAGKRAAKEARQALERLAIDHAGTPWEELAKRALSTPLGVAWESAVIR